MSKDEELRCVISDLCQQVRDRDAEIDRLRHALPIWHPIETAPENKRILVCVPIEKHRLVIAMKTKLGLFLDENWQPMQYPPFWWMQLPGRP